MRVVFNTSYWYFSKFSNFYHEAMPVEDEYWIGAGQFSQFNEYPVSVVSFMGKIHYWYDRVI